MSARHGLLALLLFGLPLGLGALYSATVFPATFRYRRLKDIPGVKSLTVASAGTIGAVALPLEIIHAQPGRLHLACGFFVMLRIFAITVGGDAFDVDGDKEEGIETLPTLLGRPRTDLVVMVGLGGSLAALSLAGLWSCHSTWVILGVAFAGTLALGLVLLESVRASLGLGAGTYDVLDLDGPVMAVLLWTALLLAE